MYDGHIYCEEYKELKGLIADIENGDAEDTNLEELADHIHELYDEGKMPATQYDDLMGYLQDFIE